MSRSRPWGAVSAVGAWRNRPLRHCSLPAPTDGDIADVMELASTPDGAVALADGIAALVTRGRDSGLLALYLHGLGRAEASWIAAWIASLTGPDD